jgi:acetyl-CoA carboxylase carboxyltransferase component
MESTLFNKTDALAFPIYPAQTIDKNSERYKLNVADWTQVLRTYQEGLQWCASQGTQYYEDRHRERGLLLARDRVHLLLDPDTPFLELGSFAGYKLDTSSPSASLITGIGLIWYLPRPSIDNSGIKCMIISHIPTLSGAAWNEFTLIKQNRMTEIATQNRLPLISLVQSVNPISFNLI